MGTKLYVLITNNCKKTYIVVKYNKNIPYESESFKPLFEIVFINSKLQVSQVQIFET